MSAINKAKNEIIQSQELIHVNTWIASVNGLSNTMESYSTIRKNRTELFTFKRDIDNTMAQLENVFDTMATKSSYGAALSYNLVAAISLVVDVDYLVLGGSTDFSIIKNSVNRIVSYNNRLLAIPARAKRTSSNPIMYQNCKILVAPFLGDIVGTWKNNILWGAFKTWSAGYHKGHEFRIYNYDRLVSKCFENKAGEDAIQFPVGRNWNNLSPRMYDESHRAVTGSSIYKATKSSNDTFKEYLRSL